MKIDNIVIVHTPPSTKEQKSTLNIVKNILKKHKLRYRLSNRGSLNKNQFKNTDLVIAVGGDGTFLRAAQFIKAQPLLGVNSDTASKEGFFMKCSKGDFKRKFSRVLKGRLRIRKLPRLEAFIDGKRVETLALNEFFIGSRKAYHAAKYDIRVGGREEKQKSSGVLVTTPAGSHAWAKSCCNRVLPLSSDGYQFVVREPYEGRVFKGYKLKYGRLGKSQKITIASEMLDGILVADSVSREYDFKKGSKATIRLSAKHLNAIWM